MGAFNRSTDFKLQNAQTIHAAATTKMLGTASTLTGLFKENFAKRNKGRHDAGVYTKSNVFKALNDDPSLLPNDTHILGDAVYPLSIVLKNLPSLIYYLSGCLLRHIFFITLNNHFKTVFEKNYHFTESFTNVTVTCFEMFLILSIKYM